MNLTELLISLKENPRNDLTILQIINCMESMGMFQCKTETQTVDMVYNLCRENGCGPGTIGKGWIHYKNKGRQIA